MVFSGLLLASVLLDDLADRASFESGVAVGRSGTHLALRYVQSLPHATVAAWLHWLCWP
jgi:hypothetical protein